MNAVRAAQSPTRMALRRALVLSLLVLTACHDHAVLVPAFSVESVECTPGSFPGTHSNPVVMLLLDRSGSMSTAFGTGTRWSVLRAALEATLPSVEQRMELGALLFPAPDASNQCAVPFAPVIDPALGNAAAIAAVLAASSPGGSTPTAETVDAAANALASSAQVGRALAMVLATDGAPNCNASLLPASCTCLDAATCLVATQCLDDTRTEATLTRWAAQGIPTWVVGIADTARNATVLDALAVSGGSGQAAIHGDSPLALENAFAEIHAQLAACVFSLPSVPDTNGSMVLTLDGVAIAADATKGWAWGDRARGEVVLHGAACTAARASENAVVEVTVTCSADASVAVIGQ
jgi:Mg-chelatase subunit ChlD